MSGLPGAFVAMPVSLLQAAGVDFPSKVAPGHPADDFMIS